MGAPEQALVRMRGEPGPIDAGVHSRWMITGLALRTAGGAGVDRCVPVALRGSYPYTARPRRGLEAADH